MLLTPLFPLQIEKGNKALLLREQSIILKSGYERLEKWRLGTVMAALSASPVPGGKSMSRVLPNGNLCNFKDRWTWISTDMLPAWLKLTVDEQAAAVKLPLGASISDLEVLMKLIRLLEGVNKMNDAQKGIK